MKFFKLIYYIWLMNEFIKIAKEKATAWKKDITKNKWKIFIALIFFSIAVVLNYIAGTYMTQKATVKEVPDLILSCIPPINLNIFFVWLFLLIIAVLILHYLILKPNKIHYFFGMFGSFVLVRALFTLLTHLKTPIDAIPVNFPFFADKIFFMNDLFFSGHTGLPFLGYLILKKDNKKLSYFFLVSSIILGISSLLMHRHYSIDVFAAFFITYGIYKIGGKIFNNENPKKILIKQINPTF